MENLLNGVNTLKIKAENGDYLKSLERMEYYKGGK